MHDELWRIGFDGNASGLSAENVNQIATAP